MELAKRFVARRGDDVRIEGVSDPNDPDSVLNQTGALLPGPTAVHPDRSCAHHNRCPHQGGALCEGKLWGVLKADRPGAFEYSPTREILTCPWHGWEFHVRTGQL